MRMHHQMEVLGYPMMIILIVCDGEALGTTIRYSVDLQIATVINLVSTLLIVVFELSVRGCLEIRRSPCLVLLNRRGTQTVRGSTFKGGLGGFPRIYECLFILFKHPLSLKIWILSIFTKPKPIYPNCYHE